MRALLPLPPPLPRRLGALAAVVLVALGVRAFVAVPRSVPSASMLPALEVGDVFLVARWPFGAPLAARLGGRGPRRGEIVVFRGPPGEADVVKRVIGLPGDRVALAAGVVLLNGRPLPRVRIADYLAPARADAPCDAVRETLPGGAIRCRTSRWHETLPDGTGWDVLDDGPSPLDDMPALTVPPGRLFLLGDNRDRSADSRLAVADGGVGLVDMRALRGRATLVVWSSERGATGGWWPAIRWHRIGRMPGAR